MPLWHLTLEVGESILKVLILPILRLILLVWRLSIYISRINIKKWAMQLCLHAHGDHIIHTINVNYHEKLFWVTSHSQRIVKELQIFGKLDKVMKMCSAVALMVHLTHSWWLIYLPHIILLELLWIIKCINIVIGDSGLVLFGIRSEPNFVVLPTFLSELS